MKEKKLALITARGGSKRIPRKNIKEFCGKPILFYSIEAAINSGVFDEVMVSTDDMEIAELAKKAGAKVPFMRSADTSNDYASTDEVIMEVLKEYEKLGITFESFCCIYPTAPFITGERLKEAMELLEQADSVMPVVPFSYPPQRGLIVNEEGYVARQFPEYATARSQDLQKIYHDCGQFYACRTLPFMEAGTTDVEKLVPLVLSEMEVQDIDTLEDWEIAEIKYLRRNK
ncbi:MAG: pseudaminic acid cytidylyltransferase [Lachnospiraceae bacterium]|nr:pseudaminic acid cytidylyltransferase [Lachnospiraceae bacterium]